MSLETETFIDSNSAFTLYLFEIEIPKSYVN